MNKDEHLEYLKWLFKCLEKSDGGYVPPVKEGAFWFKGAGGFFGYAVKYRDQCVKEGWLTPGSYDEEINSIQRRMFN